MRAAGEMGSIVLVLLGEREMKVDCSVVAVPLVVHNSPILLGNRVKDSWEHFSWLAEGRRTGPEIQR